MLQIKNLKWNLINMKYMCKTIYLLANQKESEIDIWFTIIWNVILFLNYGLLGRATGCVMYGLGWVRVEELWP